MIRSRKHFFAQFQFSQLRLHSIIRQSVNCIFFLRASSWHQIWSLWQFVAVNEEQELDNI